MNKHPLSAFLAGAVCAIAAAVLLTSPTPVQARQTCGSVGIGSGPNCIGPSAWPRSTTGSVATFWMEESTVNPSFTLPANNGVIVQHCNNRFVFTHNDGGTTKYFYIDLNGTSGTWSYTTSNPC